jgi:hypothetical protein
MPRFSDTSPEVAEMQAAAFRRMTREERLLAALEMSLLARNLARSGIRRRHPDWNEEKVRREQIRLSFDDDRCLVGSMSDAGVFRRVTEALDEAQMWRWRVLPRSAKPGHDAASVSSNALPGREACHFT